MQLPSRSIYVRVPLVVAPENRALEQDVDARLINGYVEKDFNGEYQIFKRFGFNNITSLPGQGNPLGMIYWDSSFIYIFGSHFYVDNVLVYSSLADTSTLYYFTFCLGATPKLFFKNAGGSYVYDVSNGVIPITNIATFNFTGDTTNLSAVITTIAPNTTNMRVGDSVTGSGIPSGSTIISIDSSTQITISIAATATASTVALTDVPLSVYPSSLIPGCAYLNGTIYVMDLSNNIYGSNLNNPLVWNPTNLIKAQNEGSQGRFITRQLSYLVAFKQFSIEFFYDAANPTGSSLLPVQGGFIPIGCENTDTIQTISGDIYFVANTSTTSYQVMILRNLTLNIVSTAPVERILENLQSGNTTHSFSFNYKGHSFYGIASDDIDYTMVYDISQGIWYKWDFLGSNAKIISQTVKISGDDPTPVYFQIDGIEKIYQVSDGYLDDTTPIIFDLYTPNFDGGTRKRKIVNSLEIIGDQQEGSTLQIRCSDDDYQTWSNYRTVDMSKKRPLLINCGAFRKRAYHIHQVSNTPLRIKAVEVNVEEGEL